MLRARAQRHHNFLEARIACALAQRVESHLDLPRSLLHSCKRVRRREPEIVVAVGRPDDVVAARRCLLDEVGEEGAVLCRQSVTDSVWQVDRRRARLDDCTT